MSKLINNTIFNLLDAIYKIGEDSKNPILISLIQTLKKELMEEAEISESYIANKVYDAREFLEIVTGHYYLMPDNNDFDTIHKILRQEGYEDDDCCTVWDYPLNEIDEVLANGGQAVLVSGSVWDEDCGEFFTEYRWVEIPDGCKEKFLNRED